eukprot:4004748-Pyramimonas_sp.AAC.1
MTQQNTNCLSSHPTQLQKILNTKIQPPRPLRLMATAAPALVYHNAHILDKQRAPALLVQREPHTLELPLDRCVVRRDLGA